jgi:uncharacterized membrane protein
VEIYAAAALLFAALIAVSFVMFGLAWQLRRLRRRVESLEGRLARVEHPGHHAEPATHTAAPVMAPPAQPASATPIVVTPPIGTPASAAAAQPNPLRGREPESLESRIGGQWLLYIGVLAILIGLAYFEKLAFESAWLGETARVVQGAAAGLLLAYGGIRFARAGYLGYGHAIAGAGVAALYVSIYASFNYYHLIDRTSAFVLMLVVTGSAAALSDRERSPGLAIFAVGGGYLTPFLLPGANDAQIALFGYDAVLAAGASALATRRTWPLLYATSYVGTLLTIAAWADRFYTPEKFLRTEMFLTLFCGFFAWMLRRCRLRGTLTEQLAWLILLTAPVAYYVASVAILIDHPTAFLVWVVALSAVGAALAVRRSVVLGLIVAFAVFAPLLAWCNTPIARSHVADGLSAIIGVYGLALAAQLRIAPTKREMSAPEIYWLHLNGLGAFAAVYLLLLYDHLALTALAAAVFAIWQAGVALAVRRDARQHSPHFAALGFTLAAAAIALQFDGPAVTIGWGAEGLAIVALGLHARRGWLRAAGFVLFAIAFARAVFLLTAVPIVGQHVLFNPRAACAVFLAAVAYVIAWLHRTGDSRDAAGIRAAFVLLAQVLTLLWLTSEIRTYWSRTNDTLTRQLMLSVTWAAYGTVLVVIGLRRRFAPLRIFAMVVLAITIAKVFVVDLAQLQRVYRVVSMLGLGIMLLLTSYLYQRSRAGTRLGMPQSDGDESGPAAH